VKWLEEKSDYKSWVCQVPNNAGQAKCLPCSKMIELNTNINQFNQKPVAHMYVIGIRFNTLHMMQCEICSLFF
jgi:hypothetical protein